jgi:hypothetical protein
MLYSTLVVFLSLREVNSCSQMTSGKTFNYSLAEIPSLLQLHWSLIKSLLPFKFSEYVRISRTIFMIRQI